MKGSQKKAWGTKELSDPCYDFLNIMITFRQARQVLLGLGHQVIAQSHLGRVSFPSPLLQGTEP
jgi:hypothetical protein